MDTCRAANPMLISANAVLVSAKGKGEEFGKSFCSGSSRWWNRMSSDAGLRRKQTLELVRDGRSTAVSCRGATRRGNLHPRVCAACFLTCPTVGAEVFSDFFDVAML